MVETLNPDQSGQEAVVKAAWLISEFRLDYNELLKKKPWVKGAIDWGVAKNPEDYADKGTSQSASITSWVRAKVKFKSGDTNPIYDKQRPLDPHAEEA